MYGLGRELRVDRDAEQPPVVGVRDLRRDVEERRAQERPVLVDAHHPALQRDEHAAVRRERDARRQRKAAHHRLLDEARGGEHEARLGRAGPARHGEQRGHQGEAPATEPPPSGRLRAARGGGGQRGAPGPENRTGFQHFRLGSLEKVEQRHCSAGPRSRRGICQVVRRRGSTRLEDEQVHGFGARCTKDSGAARGMPQRAVENHG